MYSQNGIWVNWYWATSPSWLQANTVPIFPPRGWAGRTDAELWEGITGERSGTMDIGPIRFLLHGSYGWCLVDLNRKSIRTENPIGMFDPAELPEYILALQNAQMLAARLGGAK